MKETANYLNVLWETYREVDTLKNRDYEGRKMKESTHPVLHRSSGNTWYRD